MGKIYHIHTCSSCPHYEEYDRAPRPWGVFRELRRVCSLGRGGVLPQAYGVPEWCELEDHPATKHKAEVAE